MNKLQTISISMLLTASVAVMANESIDTQIQKIKNASPSQRVELMNQFKKKLQKMNQEQREEAISALRTSNRPSMQNQVQNHQNDLQMNMINNTQQMNQKQTMQQWNKMGKPSHNLTNNPMK